MTSKFYFIFFFFLIKSFLQLEQVILLASLNPNYLNNEIIQFNYQN